MQVCIDSYSWVANAKFYSEQIALTAAGLLKNSILPFYQDQSIPILGILTDLGTEYKQKIEYHAFELFKYSKIPSLKPTHRKPMAKHLYKLGKIVKNQPLEKIIKSLILKTHLMH